MIDPHIPAFLLIGVGFLKKGVAAEAYDWKPTKNDVLALRAELKQYEPTVINGRKQWPMEQHLVKKGICAFLDNGQLAVSSPELYKREQDIYGLHQWMNEKDQETMFKQFPEEKAIWRANIQAMFKDMKGVDKKIASA